MLIQNKTFPDGIIIFYTDYKTSAHAGAGGCFQISDIVLEEKSIVKDLRIDQGHHYHNIKQVIHDLSLPSDFNEYEEIIIEPAENDE